MEQRYTRIGKDGDVELSEDFRLFGYNITKDLPPVAVHLNKAAKNITYQIKGAMSSIKAIEYVLQTIKKDPVIGLEFKNAARDLKDAISALNQLNTTFGRATKYSDDKMNYELRRDKEIAEKKLKDLEDKQKADLVRRTKEQLSREQSRGYQGKKKDRRN